MSILTGGLGADETALILQGYGYIDIVIFVPEEGVEELRPEFFRVEKKYWFPLSELGIIKEFRFEEKIHTLSVLKSARIKILLLELGIVLPEEIRVLLNGLSMISKESKKVSIKELRSALKMKKIYTVESLGIIVRLKEIVTIKGLSVISKKISEIPSAPPDLVKIKMDETLKAMKKYMELLNLIDKMDE